MPKKKPELVICHYHVKPGKEKDFEKLLKIHWPTLKKLKLCDEKEKPQYFCGQSKAGPVYYEIFAWVNGDAAARAHELPELMAIWEPMGALCSEMNFPHVMRVKFAR